MGIWYCSVANCKSKSSDKEQNSIRFFGFPVNCSEEWIKAVNIPDWTPKKYSKICSLHFPKTMIIGQKLIPGAVPCSQNVTAVYSGE